MKTRRGNAWPVYFGQHGQAAANLTSLRDDPTLFVVSTVCLCRAKDPAPGHLRIGGWRLNINSPHLSCSATVATYHWVEQDHERAEKEREGGRLSSRMPAEGIFP
jgi:hypothetical protein